MPHGGIEADWRGTCAPRKSGAPQPLRIARHGRGRCATHPRRHDQEMPVRSLAEIDARPSELYWENKGGSTHMGEHKVRPEDVGLGVLYWIGLDGAVVVDADECRIRLVNPAAEELLGRPAAELVGQLAESLVRPQLARAVRRL